MVSFLIRTVAGAVVLFLVVELFGEVQDERIETVDVRFSSRTRGVAVMRRPDGMVREKDREERYAPPRRNPRNRTLHCQSARRCARRSATRPR